MARPKRPVTAFQSRWWKGAKTWRELRETKLESCNNFDMQGDQYHEVEGASEGLTHGGESDSEEDQFDLIDVPHPPHNGNEQFNADQDMLDDNTSDSFMAVSDEKQRSKGDGCDVRVPMMHNEDRIKVSEAAPSFMCTGCGTEVTMFDSCNHPQLEVGICRLCRKFLFSSPFTKDIDGSERECRWCGQGGEIILCDTCDKVFCNQCVRRNFGQERLDEIVSLDKWSCFFCNPEPLRDLFNEYKEFLELSARSRNMQQPIYKNPPAASRQDHEPILEWKASIRRTKKPRIRKKSTVLERACEESDKIKGLLNHRKMQDPKLKSPTWAKVLAGGKTSTPKVDTKQTLHQGNDKENLHSEPPQARSYLRPHQLKRARQEAATERKKLLEDSTEAEQQSKTVSHAPEHSDVGDQQMHQNVQIVDNNDNEVMFESCTRMQKDMDGSPISCKVEGDAEL